MTLSLDRLDPDVRSVVLAKAFWALGHPIRMRIIQALTDNGETTVGELADQLPVSQPQVSVHLACLTECGFTAVRREGRRAFYRIASPWVPGLLSLIGDHADFYCSELLECAGCAPTEVGEERSVAAALGS